MTQDATDGTDGARPRSRGPRRRPADNPPIALVTGASSGIGAATADRLAAMRLAAPALRHRPDPARRRRRPHRRPPAPRRPRRTRRRPAPRRSRPRRPCGRVDALIMRRRTRLARPLRPDPRRHPGPDAGGQPRRPTAAGPAAPARDAGTRPGPDRAARLHRLPGRRPRRGRLRRHQGRADHVRREPLVRAARHRRRRPADPPRSGGNPFFATRGTDYQRERPRPVSAEAVADLVHAAITTGRDRAFLPHWLDFPARIHGAAPGFFRRMAARFG